jgi:hypothetical protein
MRLLLFAAGVLWSLATAQNGLTLYLPLDNRPPNWLPCTWGLVICPPAQLYQGQNGADPAQLAAWLDRTWGTTLIASMDALVYGGLVQSRNSQIPAEEARNRIAPVLAWKARTGGRTLIFGVIPRAPDSKNRARNLEVLRSLTPEAGFDYVEVPWDDALPGSPAIAEAATLEVFTRPGADETGQILLLRALRPGLRVKVLYDNPAAAKQVVRYDGIPLGDSIARLLHSAGALQVNENPDLVLVAYTGPDPRQGLLTILRGLREARVAVADIARVNRGDPALMKYLLGTQELSQLAAYSAWGTPSNNIGTALAQGGLFLKDEKRRSEVLARSWLEYLWGEIGRPWVRERFPEPLTEEAQRYVLERLKRESTPVLGLGKLELTGLQTPWRRSFEAYFNWRWESLGLWP